MPYRQIYVFLHSGPTNISLLTPSLAAGDVGSEEGGVIFPYVRDYPFPGLWIGYVWGNKRGLQ